MARPPDRTCDRDVPNRSARSIWTFPRHLSEAIALPPARDPGVLVCVALVRKLRVLTLLARTRPDPVDPTDPNLPSLPLLALSLPPWTSTVSFVPCFPPRRSTSPSLPSVYAPRNAPVPSIGTLILPTAGTPTPSPGSQASSLAPDPPTMIP